MFRIAMNSTLQFAQKVTEQEYRINEKILQTFRFPHLVRLSFRDFRRHCGVFDARLT